VADIETSSRNTFAWAGTTLRPGEAVFALFGLPLALLCVVYVFVTVYAGTVLGLTFIGLPVLASGLRGARRLGDAHRILVRRTYGEAIAEPVPLARSSGLITWVRAGLTDPVSWRSMVYLALRLPVAVLGGLAVAGLPAAAVWLVGYPFWIRALADPSDQVPPLWTLVVVVPLGLLVAFVTPSAIRATSSLNLVLARLLLGPSPGQARLSALTQARGTLAAQNARSLRWIERDLHDGTQAELVAIAITLSLAEDELLSRPGIDLGRLPELLNRARRQTDTVIAGLRRITNGINPVALDGGLGAALPALVAGCPVPVILDLDIDSADRPDPAIERVVYFCVAELLTNIAKHSAATSARVTASNLNDQIHITVSDDGGGGAWSGAGSGLSGLAERLAAVDGTITVESPAGGGTMVTAQLPSRVCPPVK
jgi:signal transduction histidine kinase